MTYSRSERIAHSTMPAIIIAVLLSFTLTVQALPPMSISMDYQTANVTASTEESMRLEPIQTNKYLNGLVFASVLSEEEKDINKEILEAAYSYMEDTSYFPNRDAGALYMVAATSQENRGSGNSNIFSGVRMTEEVYRSNPNALKAFSHNNTYGLDTYSGRYLGPLSLSPDHLGKSIDAQEIGTIGAVNGNRVDILGTRGDRMNWYDSCNMTAYMLDLAWKEYQTNPEYKRGIDVQNEYAVVAITAMSMHQGISVLGMPDDFLPSGQAECATPKFWFDWVNIMTQPKYIDTIRLYVNRTRPLSYTNDTTINQELIIPIMDSMKVDALAMNPNFFAPSRYQAGYNWIAGNRDERAYVGGSGEKTSAALKVLVSYVIMEERYAGSW